MPLCRRCRNFRSYDIVPGMPGFVSMSMIPETYQPTGSLTLTFVTEFPLDDPTASQLIQSAPPTPTCWYCKEPLPPAAPPPEDNETVILSKNWQSIDPLTAPNEP